MEGTLEERRAERWRGVEVEVQRGRMALPYVYLEPHALAVESGGRHERRASHHHGIRSIRYLVW